MGPLEAPAPWYLLGLDTHRPWESQQLCPEARHPPRSCAQAPEPHGPDCGLFTMAPMLETTQVPVSG